MREAKKILSFIKKSYPQEIAVFESMNAKDRKHYASYVLRKGRDFLSPSAWLWRKSDTGMSFEQIAKKLGIDLVEVILIYNDAMTKIKEIMMCGENREYFEHMHLANPEKIEELDFVANKRVQNKKLGNR